MARWRVSLAASSAARARATSRSRSDLLRILASATLCRRASSTLSTVAAYCSAARSVSPASRAGSASAMMPPVPARGLARTSQARAWYTGRGAIRSRRMSSRRSPGGSRVRASPVTSPAVARVRPGSSWITTPNPVSWCRVSAMPGAPAVAAISFSLRWTSMILVRVDTVELSSALSVATSWLFTRSAAISSSLAMTVPLSCASTDSRKTSSAGRGSPPVTTRKTGSPPSRDISGNAQQEGEPSRPSRLGSARTARASARSSGARS